MRLNINIKGIIIVLIIVVVFGGFFYWWYNSGTKSEGLSAADIPTEPKHYEVNEYSSVLISDQAMSVKYLNNYLNIISTNLQQAYNLLDEEYRDAKFGSFENFQRYINERKNSFTEINRYNVTGNIYYIYDNNNNLFIFSTKGVMNYKVYFDDTTVEIKK